MPILSQLGPYYIDEELAEGGMARVFRARLRGLGGFEKTLVIKQIKPELAKDPRFVELFVREANTLVSLSHPHIVPVYELGAAEGTYYLSMEYVEGVTVARMLDDGPLPPELVAHLGAQVCDALDYAHGRFGILHRDITPRNILVDRAGHARLVDFGIAGALGVVDRDVLGSPGYMAPEQARRRALSPATDLFALGAVLYEALTGRAAFAKTPRGTLEPAPSLANDPHIPDAFKALIAAMLAEAPEARPESASEVARQLRGYLSQAKPEGVLEQMRERVHTAGSARPSPPPAVEEGPRTVEVTARVEARAIATSSVLTELLRSASGVGSPIPTPEQPGAKAPAPAEERPAQVPGTRRIEEVEPDDPTNAVATRWMMQAWPWLALVALVAGTWFALQRPHPAANAPASEPSELAQTNETPLAPPATPALTQDEPPSASPAETPSHEVSAQESEKPSTTERSASATLSVSATPWGEVSIDGRPQGNTPLRDLKLRAGSHVIRVHCPPLARTAELRVHVPAGSRARIAVDLTVDPPRTFLDGLDKVR